MPGSDLIGREPERARLTAALAEAAAGRGSLVLLTGEAGVGKTLLAERILTSRTDVRFVRGAATPESSPYGSVVAALRSFLRTRPAGLDDCGPLRSHLALLLPEIGAAEPTLERGTLVEAVRCGLAAMAADSPTAVLMDDLQWSDEATLEFLAAAAPGLDRLPLLVVAAYRSDEVSRAHPMRRLRHELRRARALNELTIPPFSEPETGALIEQVLGAPPSHQLKHLLHERTGGNPFYVEELTQALSAEGRLRPSPDGLQLQLDGEVPIPPTVRDAVLVRTSGLPDAARATAELAAVAGPRFDLRVVAQLDDAGFAELVACGLVVETEPGSGSFRHPLAREAIYEDIPWLRRRALHRRLAEELTRLGADDGEIAGHWLAAHDEDAALGCLLSAIDARARVHADRDAVRLGRRVLELWPDGERIDERIAVLEAHSRYAELAGDLGEAARAQREVVLARRIDGSGRALADAERRMALIWELQGDRQRALAARGVAAEAYAANGLPGEAAAERLVIAGYLQSAGSHSEAVRVAVAARAEASKAKRTDLQARALGLEGVALAKGGAYANGVATIRKGLSLALRRGHTPEAAEVYQRLGTAHEVAGDYPSAHVALGTALELCERSERPGLQNTCIGCIAYVLRELGDWDEAVSLSQRLIAPGATPQETLVADGVLGAIYAWRGMPREALGPLTRCLETSTRLDVVSMQCDSAAALAWLAVQTGDIDRAESFCRMLLDRWERSEDHHYAVWGLRWGAGWLATVGLVELARACAESLSRIATSAGCPDAQAALSHALAETALADGQTDIAADHFARALEIHRGLNIPFERAQITLCCGSALATIGDTEGALEHFVEAHRLAQDLGAAPLAAAAVDGVRQLGESIEAHLGRRAAAEHESGGLSRREVEVIRLVSEGLTNREIANRLVLSTRTVDMHVRHILTKLRCRTRTEAASRAAELGVLSGAAEQQRQGPPV